RELHPRDARHRHRHGPGLRDQPLADAEVPGQPVARELPADRRAAALAARSDRGARPRAARLADSACDRDPHRVAWPGAMSTVLVIDDNPAVATALEVLFSLRDLRTLRADSPARGLALLDRESVDVVIQDMNFRADTTSGEEGIALFREIRARLPDLPVILMTAWTQLESAVELVKAGAADYLAKPWDDAKLLTTVQNLLELSQTRRELARRRSDESRRRAELEQRYDLCGAVFADPTMERVIALACQVARADVPVLITGPNGAGKEKIAEIVQANSAVRDGPFVVLNCGALPSELVE